METICITHCDSIKKRKNLKIESSLKSIIENYLCLMSSYLYENSGDEKCHKAIFYK